MRRLLLFSTSTLHGQGYFDYAEPAVRRHFARGVERVLFVPFALHDHEAYAARVRERFAPLGLGVDSLHAARDAAGRRALVERAQAVFIGGGNTFRLLRALYESDLLGPLRERALAGMPYVGSSAGTNVACATIQTTNDMPITHPPALEALALVPFNINPHYQDPDPRSTHMGETREQRIREFHEVNTRPVVGLREGGWLDVEGDSMALRGTTNARLFRRGQEPEEFAPEANLDFLLHA